jgi:Domain of unknown function (DUF5069)
MTTPQASESPRSGPPPRRWTVEVDGIRWIPRMADKARMLTNGIIGPYLMGHSPVDKALLARLGMNTEEWVDLVTKNGPEDMAVLQALRARGFDEDRVRRWSADFEKTYKGFIPLWDLDEGYRAPNAMEKPLLAFAKIVEGPVMSMFRKISPAP